MPACESCGRHLTADTVRVLYPADVDDPQRCPFCDESRKSGFDPREGL